MSVLIAQSLRALHQYRVMAAMPSAAEATLSARRKRHCAPVRIARSTASCTMSSTGSVAAPQTSHAG